MLAAVIDLFSRRVVGWSMSAAMTAQLVTDALVMAIWRRGRPNALLHRSAYTPSAIERCIECLHEISVEFRYAPETSETVR
jgi:putative transposase